MDIRQKSKIKTYSKSKFKEINFDHGQQTQQTIARRRRAVAAPTVTPMATVNLNLTNLI